MPYRDTLGVTGDRNYATKQTKPIIEKSPLEKAVIDLKFMKDKAHGRDPKAEIIWGMAITLCEDYL